ncbi:4-hydroxyphenyl-beta-ketoacyl-CoA hydrolase [Microbacterium sp. Root53]|uniref:amidohydrolase family protein n=1 Tax=Microbacterium sp. Root53 TaxID=1736553 RepID=UPI0006F75868|nr:amidohydrolase family protein [Microbacterium sp. Root53]KQY97630.1 4-hydroxyphenyl-beta-ketoacyl-CoA hydrolase [Microbacterium sp. Root53]
MTRYEPAIDVDAIEAIDTHVHIEVDAHGHSSLPDDLQEAASRYFRTDGPRPDLDGVAEYYRERRMAAVVFTVDATTNLGQRPISSADIAEGAARNNDVLIPFASVDPNREDALDEMRRLLDEHGVRGFKFHPTVQGFSPDDPRYFPVYELVQEAAVPALFHTGQTGIGAGMPGGRGLRLALSNPMLLDAMAAEFPDLQIVMAHPSVPWQDEALAVATHKHSTWIDLSGWSPKYFPAELVRYANSVLKDRILFGSDFPLLTPDRWMRDAETAGTFKPEVLPGIMKHNAVRLLGLS